MDKGGLETSLQTQAHPEMEVSTSHSCKVEPYQALAVGPATPKTRAGRAQADSAPCIHRCAHSHSLHTRKRHWEPLFPGDGSGTQAGQESSPQGSALCLCCCWQLSHHGTRSAWGLSQPAKPIWKEPPTPPCSSSHPRRGAALVAAAVSHCLPCSCRQHKLRFLLRLGSQ